ncbi:hypothetical protein EJB05_50246, partial [Eragrostis curvula]
MSGSGSSSSSRVLSCSWNGEEETRESPIRYRVGPLAYEPAVYCNCVPVRKAALWISWSNKNPGRRYLKCYRARQGGCGFIGWYEGPHDPFVQTLLIDLRDAVWELKKQRSVLKLALKEASEDHEAKKKELEDKVNRLELEKLVMRAVCACLLAILAYLLFR